MARLTDKVLALGRCQEDSASARLEVELTMVTRLSIESCYQPTCEIASREAQHRVTEIYAAHLLLWIGS